MKLSVWFLILKKRLNPFSEGEIPDQWDVEQVRDKRPTYKLGPNRMLMELVPVDPIRTMHNYAHNVVDLYLAQKNGNSCEAELDAAIQLLSGSLPKRDFFANVKRGKTQSVD